MPADESRAALLRAEERRSVDAAAPLASPVTSAQSRAAARIQRRVRTYLDIKRSQRRKCVPLRPSPAARRWAAPRRPRQPACRAVRAPAQPASPPAPTQAARPRRSALRRHGSVHPRAQALALTRPSPAAQRRRAHPTRAAPVCRTQALRPLSRRGHQGAPGCRAAAHALCRGALTRFARRRRCSSGIGAGALPRCCARLARRVGPRPRGTAAARAPRA